MSYISLTKWVLLKFIYRNFLIVSWFIDYVITYEFEFFINPSKYGAIYYYNIHKCF
jgi:hypothetical protein